MCGMGGTIAGEHWQDNGRAVVSGRNDCDPLIR
jgi:hypothetical protein